MRFRTLPLLPLLSIACHGGQPAERNDPTVRSAAVFTQSFYDWYAANGERLEAVLAKKPDVFGTALLAALRADVEAQAKSPKEIVGIDWDPFTNSQDPCNPYQVAAVSQQRDTVLVAMKGMCTDAAQRAAPDVIAHLQRRDSSWVFVDFTSPGDSLSLLGHLELLRRGRNGAVASERH